MERASSDPFRTHSALTLLRRAPILAIGFHLAWKPRFCKGEKPYLFSHLFSYALIEMFAQSVVNTDLSSFFYEKKIYSHFSKIDQIFPFFPRVNI